MKTITIEIPVELYNQMKQFPDVNWSEVVMKAIMAKLKELQISKKLAKKEFALAKKLASASDKNKLYGTEKELFKKLRRK